MKSASLSHSYRLKQQATRLSIHLVLLFFSITFLLPLLLIVSASLTDEKAIGQYGYSLIPPKFSAFAYQYLFMDPQQIINAYGVTVLVTAIGSALGLLVMALLAYVLSRRDFSLRKPLSFYVFFTLIFNGGLVPWYILISQYLRLQDTLLVLILPYLVVPWFVLLLRTYFAALPDELLDAAKLDGAGEWRIFFQIVVPLSKPALATIGLFCMLMYWNDWWLGLLFINDPHLVPLQYLLYRISANIDFLASSPQTTGIPVPIESVRMAMAVLATGPLAVAFLFVQRYFIRGITLGGIKGG
ncbi:MAG: carbohydrate ABC transporter permease [Ktedonobacteraceae bacterium]|jgi:putative aldouronate transport system permease protein